MANKIYTGDTALRMTFDFVDDITGYQSLSAQITYPGASTATWTLTVSDASNGSAYFETFLSTTLKSTGKYYAHPTVWFTSTASKGETATFKVYGNNE